MLALKETFYDKTRKECKFEIVLNMINDNLSNETISKYSELEIEEIEKIREEHSKQ